MDLILAKKRVLLLVSGGIAIYKSLDLISALKKEGAEIFVVMSEEATRFIAPRHFLPLTCKSFAISTSKISFFILSLSAI